MHKFYPIYLSLHNKKCLVIGGGKVAERKVKSLLECGAKVWIVSPSLTKSLTILFKREQIRWLNREYISDDLEGCFLVISATDDSDINKKIADDCLTRNIPVNVVDIPDKCSFICPSVVRRGDLCIAISTSGKSPMLSKGIRKKLEELFGIEYEEYLDLLGILRKKIIQDVPDIQSRKKIFECLVNSDILQNIKDGKKELIEEKIEKCLSL